MLIAILVTLIFIALILGRTNQYLALVCKNQRVVHHESDARQAQILRELKRK